MNKVALVVGLALVFAATPLILQVARSSVGTPMSAARNVEVEHASGGDDMDDRSAAAPPMIAKGAASQPIPAMPTSGGEGVKPVRRVTGTAASGENGDPSALSGAIDRSGEPSVAVSATADASSGARTATSLGSTPEGNDLEDNLQRQLRPLLRTCYDQEVDRHGDQTDVNLSFNVTIAAGMGAVVHSVTLEAGVIDPTFAQCIQESVGSIAPFDASGPPERVISIPLSFGGHDE